MIKMSKPLIIIDPGHGGKDWGGGTDNGIVEKSMVLDISLYQNQRFGELGVHTTLTRSDDTYLSSDVRAAMVRDSGATYCISNHINAASTTSDSAQGIEVIRSHNDLPALANRVVDRVSEAGQVKRLYPVYTKSGNGALDYYFMHRLTRPVQTVIIEYGFATHLSDAERLKKHWKDYAEAVVKAFCEHVGHPYRPVSEPLPQIQRRGKVIVGDYEDDGYLIDDRLYVPVRFVSEGLGHVVDWNNATKTATVRK